MKLLSVKPSEKKDKRYVAEFCSCDGKSKCKSERRKKTHFGYKGGSTYIDHKDNQKKDDTLFADKRHDFGNMCKTVDIIKMQNHSN